MVDNDIDVQRSQPASASRYIKEATEEFFGDAGTIDARDWSRAAAGFVTLIILGAIILAQVITATPSTGVH